MLSDHACLAFNMNKNKTVVFIHWLLEDYMDYLMKEVEEQYQKTLRREQKEDKFLGLVINNVKLYRDKRHIGYSSEPKGFLFISKPNEDESKLSVLYSKFIKDIRFFQQWFSLMLNKEGHLNSSITPPCLNEYYFGYAALNYHVPQGKEATWKKGEQLVKYYRSLKMIL